MIDPLLPDDPRDVAGYVLRGRLGQGGMGSVYLSHTRGGQPVALKVVRPDLARDAEFRRRFEREVQAARRVHGPYTAPVLDSDTDGPLPWLAGAYVAGPPLSEAVRVHGPLPVESALLLVAGVAEALEAVHAAGVIHRDLKPSNVLLAADGPRVIDFGIARAADTTALTGSDVMVGTPAYMSPEQVLGKPVGFASDVFSLALVGHYAATGDHPFGQGHAQALMYRIVGEAPDLSASPAVLRDLFAACLAKEPADRPSLADVIEGCRRGADVTVLVRGANWLPAGVVREIAEREAAPSHRAVDRVSAGPAIPPPPMPAGRPWAPPKPSTGPSTSPPPLVGPPSVGPGPYAAGVGPVAPTPGPVGFAGPPPPPLFPPAHPLPVGGTRRPWARVAMAAGAAVAVVVAAVLIVPPLLDGDGGKDSGSADGSGADPATGLRQTRAKVPMVIEAPTIPTASFLDDDVCKEGFATRIDLEKLSVTTRLPDAEDRELLPTTTLKYVACHTESGTDADRSITAELRFLDPRAVAGFVGRPDATAAECRIAARTAALPASVPLTVLNSSAASANVGICVETGRQTLVLVWLTGVRDAEAGHGLRTFTAVATQWKPGS
ncbi:serine/threonine-protein kinase [Embleya hyalina]|uniref:Serine/threonine protein kinase n=1 Tax=Embleya hyalina TaxID=516124 RepID=A0A401YUE0_9ACTN|nr:serine/threonine-protein kinase [Embleya hyalina]GCD98243.1 serine/threonine protein kinase [Embleya hyalina]